jgi:hypothetical protein
MTRPRRYREDHSQSANYIESLARSFSESAVRTLAGIMTEEGCSAKDRIRAAEILLDRGWGKAIEHHVLADVQGSTLTKVVREIVHLEPMSREQLEETDLLVEWKEVSNDEHTNGGGQ